MWVLLTNRLLTHSPTSLATIYKPIRKTSLFSGDSRYPTLSKVSWISLEIVWGTRSKCSSLPIRASRRYNPPANVDNTRSVSSPADALTQHPKTQSSLPTSPIQTPIWLVLYSPSHQTNKTITGVWLLPWAGIGWRRILLIVYPPEIRLPRCSTNVS